MHFPIYLNDSARNHALNINTAVKNANVLNLKRETQKKKLLPSNDLCRANMTPCLVRVRANEDDVL